eukprot:scaffold34601_cov234-Amphora_coffeaeformis.AAC.7
MVGANSFPEDDEMQDSTTINKETVVTTLSRASYPHWGDLWTKLASNENLPKLCRNEFPQGSLTNDFSNTKTSIFTFYPNMKSAKCLIFTSRFSLFTNAVQ